MLKRSRESKKDPKANHMSVIYGFMGICAIAVLLSIFSPKQKFSNINAIDESAILVHNGNNYQFKQGSNSFFLHKTLADAKELFTSALSDSNKNSMCRTSKGAHKDGDLDITLPESYDWRTQYSVCVQPVMNIGTIANCSSSYSYATLSTAEDRICMKSFEKVRLST